MGLINFIYNNTTTVDKQDSKGNWIISSTNNDTGFAKVNSQYGNNQVLAAFSFVENLFNSMFKNTNNIQINITVNFDSHNGVGGQNWGAGDWVPVSYTSLVSALNANAQTSTQLTAYGQIPSTNTVNGGATNISIQPVLAANLGLTQNPDTTPGAPYQFNATLTLNAAWDWSTSLSIPNGQLVGILEHEITEIMGRVTYPGSGPAGPGGNNPTGSSIMDFWRYSAPGVPEVRANSNTYDNTTKTWVGTDPYPKDGYFSIDGGKTVLGGGFFYNGGGGPFGAGGDDLADWIQPTIVPSDSFGPSPGTPDNFSLQDLYMLNVMGWNFQSDITVDVPYGVIDWVGPHTVTIPGTTTTISAIDLGSNRTVEGFLDVASGGVANSDGIVNGGSATIEGGGLANGLNIFDGGNVEVQNGGITSNTEIFGNGTETIDAGGLTSGFTVFANGTQDIYGSATSGYVEGYENVHGSTTYVTVDVGGYQGVFAGGTTTSSVLNGGSEDLEGTANETTVNNNGYLYVEGLGQAVGTIINLGGHEIVDGGTDTNATIYGSQTVQFGGSATNDTVENGGVQNIITGTVNHTTILTGGILYVSSTANSPINIDVEGGHWYLAGIVQDPTTIEDGGVETILVGGSDTGALVYSGNQDVFGSAVNAVLFAGGTQIIEAGGSAIGTVMSGGTQTVLTGGTANGTVIGDGGTEYVSSGGTVTNTTIDGGTLFVSSGGTAVGTTVTNGGISINAADYPNTITLPSTSTGNLGQVGTNASTLIDASQTKNVTFKVTGNGDDAVIVGSNDTVYIGNGNDKIIGGANDTIVAGNGNDSVNAGPNSTITVGNGNDTVKAGANSSITTVGNGNDTIFAGANDLINIGKGIDTVAFGQSPNPTAIGNETINGFNPAQDTIQFNLALFANYAAAMADAKQVGANTVFTIDAQDSVTLQNVNLASLTSNNFRFS